MTLKLRSSKTNREGSYWFVYPQSIENSCATRVNTQCKNEKEMALKIVVKIQLGWYLELYCNFQAFRQKIFGGNKAKL